MTATEASRDLTRDVVDELVRDYRARGAAIERLIVGGSPADVARQHREVGQAQRPRTAIVARIRSVDVELAAALATESWAAHRIRSDLTSKYGAGIEVAAWIAARHHVAALIDTGYGGSISVAAGPRTLHRVRPRADNAALIDGGLVEEFRWLSGIVVDAQTNEPGWPDRGGTRGKLHDVLEQIRAADPGQAAALEREAAAVAGLLPAVRDPDVMGDPDEPVRLAAAYVQAWSEVVVR